MENELVSIVMVNYNQEKFLKKSIDSVLMQTYRNWELIIVDDGSTDASVNIIKEYKDDRIKPIFLKENCHICIATNTGFAVVKGKYIARLDSDDIWEKEKLEKPYSSRGEAELTNSFEDAPQVCTPTQR